MVTQDFINTYIKFKICILVATVFFVLIFALGELEPINSNSSTGVAFKIFGFRGEVYKENVNYRKLFLFDDDGFMRYVRIGRLWFTLASN